MAALHELSVRLSILGRSLPLSTMKGSCRRELGFSGRRSSSAVQSFSFLCRPAVVDLFRPHFEDDEVGSSRGLNRPNGTGRRQAGERHQSCRRMPRLDIVTSGISRQYHSSTANAFVSNGASETERTQVFVADELDVNDRSSGNQRDRKGEEVNDDTKRYSNYLAMSDQELFAKCRMDTYKGSGPGGQHRNKTESAVRLTHLPTGLVAQASEERSQHSNRSVALVRLRKTIALEVRDFVELDGYEPSPELVRILPTGGGGKKKGSQKIGPNHPEFVQGMKGLIDLLWATEGSVSDAAKALGLSTGALSKLITSNGVLWQGINKLRASKGLKPLR